ncbi:AmpG family muropeptide MFS transporter [Lichenicola sp.]|uniref:AmpG family muropeptide MFS transporter n=1 Tax=Lichenicola sp. TaxID=2804529 RepID=UPI003AFF8E9E
MIALMGGFGFASGLPLFLTFFTLQQWLSESHISLRAIGAAALIGLPYLLKFLWAPLLDRMPPTPLTRLGRRRGWILPIQALLTLAIVLMADCQPARALWPLVCAAVALAFFSASQDIVIDAWRIETFPGRLQAAALGAYTWGYRIAMLCSGAGAIWLAAKIGWHLSLLAMAALSLIGPFLALIAPEPALVPAHGATGSGWRHALRARVLEPFRDLLGRPDAWMVIAFVLVFNLGTQLADTMAYPLYRALGFAPTAVAAANGIPSLCAALAGAAASGVLVARIGIGRSLILCAVVQMCSILLYVALVRSGPVFAMLFAKVTLEGFAEVLAATTFATYLSRLCSLEYTATQYALLSSLAPVAWRTLGGTTGFLAQGVGWTSFYLLTVGACLPGILIMVLLLRRHPGGLPSKRAHIIAA